MLGPPGIGRIAAEGGRGGAAGGAAEGGRGGAAGGTAEGGRGGGAGTEPTGGSSGGTGGTSTGGTGGGGTGGSSTGGSGGDTGTCVCNAPVCVLPDCLKNLGTDCVESGACTIQKDLASGNTNTCYDNGVAEIVVHDTMTDDSTLTLKKGTSTCFSTTFNGNDVYNGAGAITVINASGTAVASVAIDYVGRFFVVTCTGGQDVALDSSCSNVWPLSVLMGSDCQNEGDCQP